LKAAHPEIPWDDVAGMRNRLVHAYLDVDLEVVWNTMVSDLPALLHVAEAELERLGAE
jgi:uncharacterized protein with HEPN domain